MDVEAEIGHRGRALPLEPGRLEPEVWFHRLWPGASHGTTDRARHIAAAVPAAQGLRWSERYGCSTEVVQICEGCVRARGYRASTGAGWPKMSFEINPRRLRGRVAMALVEWLSARVNGRVVPDSGWAISVLPSRLDRVDGLTVGVLTVEVLTVDMPTRAPVGVEQGFKHPADSLGYTLCFYQF